jgi:hypothetical protein
MSKNNIFKTFALVVLEYKSSLFKILVIIILQNNKYLGFK